MWDFDTTDATAYQTKSGRTEKANGSDSVEEKEAEIPLE